MYAHVTTLIHFTLCCRAGRTVYILPRSLNFENETHGNGNSQATRQMKTIDVTTSASVLFGLTNMILTEMVSHDILDDPDIEKIYRNTTSMLTFLIRTNFSGRPDIALTYHPSEFQLYWSVARTLSILRRHIMRHGLYHQALVAVMLELKEVLQGPCTDRLLSIATTVGPGQVYFEDYNMNRETRLFSTAMAMLTILSSWTVFDEGSGYLVWEEYTPADLIVTMERAATWLNRYILGEKYRPGNELLSWQRRGVHLDTFPANVCLYENGTASPITPQFPCDDPLNSTRAVQGVVSAEWYQDQLTGGKTVERGHGYGDATSENLIWTSKALTYATSMYALSCHHNTIAYDEAYRKT
ncbi:uncharacterized protein LOC110460987 [Mizuhopecten yessoensis]|uniref:uncharacterized protein LOC110460987 n=1 Tax=Mizuhopecten yessoensis TaxID=6573 RepID=UPI000B457A28|nr:uncharacterized protein LOC110460987 [Mizuhopecten yessoensis]